MIQSVLNAVQTTNLDSLREYAPNHPELFDTRMGREHYRLLAAFSKAIPDGANIIDIGTHVGDSALALSFNEKNTIYTFDIVNKIPSTSPLRKRNNIKFVIADLFSESGRAKWEEILLASPLIFLDVDPHNGDMEISFYNYLKEKNYQGLVICDDIWYFKDMRNNFWYKLPTECKLDVTPYGHWSGSALLSFNKELQEQFANLRYDNSNWTLVTAYFNLAKCKDASAEIKARDKSYYFSHAMSTLSLDYNLVVYCDQESYEDIVKMRPERLQDKTRYVICDFEEIAFDHDKRTFAEYREKIIENRISHPYQFDPRNTASYYLFCMSRYMMLKKEIEVNHFKSTHFAWINFCIERMGYQNLVRMDEAFAQNRDKFSTCWIDYQPYSLIANTKEYFKFGRCGMCSGFFTGNAHYMHKVCDLIERKFLYYLNRAYGHSDETLYSPVYFENPGLFDAYFGDYEQMITNYVFTYDKPENPIRNVIRNSFDNGDFLVCLKACKQIWESYKLGKCELSRDWLEKLTYYYMLSEFNTTK